MEFKQLWHVSVYFQENFNFNDDDFHSAAPTDQSLVPTWASRGFESVKPRWGDGEIPWDSPGKVWKPRIFGQKLPKMSQSAWTVLFFFQMSGFPTFKPKRVAMLAKSSCHEFPVPPRYQYRAKPLKSRLPYAKNKFSKRCQISNGSKMATEIANDQPVQPSTRWVFWCFLKRWFHIAQPVNPRYVLTSKRSGSSWSSNL